MIRSIVHFLPFIAASFDPNPNTQNGSLCGGQVKSQVEGL